MLYNIVLYSVYCMIYNVQSNRRHENSELILVKICSKKYCKIYSKNYVYCVHYRVTHLILSFHGDFSTT